MMNIRRKFLLSTLSFCLAFCLLGTNSYAAPTTFDKNDDDYGFGEFDLGTLVIDLSKGDAVVDIGKEPQGEAYYYSFKGLLFPETTPDEKPATVEANAHTVGEQITIDGAIYQITDLTAGNESIMYVKPEDTGIKSAIIPDTVNIDGVDYKVTDIEDNAFKGCKKLKKVTIGENVLRIGTKAFYKCKKLKKITIKTSALTKDSVDKGVFKGINENAKVKVPKKKVKAYRKIFKKKGLNGKNQKVTK
ncbi:leucine-rich repeat protein [Butyrivibrio sp. FC2001]|uniref:leucine-rich repeat protein n=1 Tax=Butyrivibrio sp. FC2001 TaxID=1280671 RepID=UPI0009DB9737|nr:leucine-rich repeat protein [Butyrivibrio sp. FC2001]